MIIDTAKLVGAEELLEKLFAVNCRPKPRTLQRWRQQRIVPFYKVHGLVFFDVDECRDALMKKKRIRAI